MSTKLPVQLIDPTGTTSGQVPVSTGPNTAPQWESVTVLGGLVAANNLSDVANTATALTNLGGGAKSAPLSQFASTTSGQLAGVLSDETGSGVVVFNIAPALTNPVVTGGSVNGATVGATTASSGKFTTIAASGLISPTSTVGIQGTVAVDNAQAGSVGEYASNTTLATSIATGTVTNATSVSLTAGDWDVSGVARFNPAGTTVITSQLTGVSPTSATSSGFGTVNSLNFSAPAGVGCQIVAPVARISLSATTTIFLIALTNFTVSTCTVDGFIRARRVR